MIIELNGKTHTIEKGDLAKAFARVACDVPGCLVVYYGYKMFAVTADVVATMANNKAAKLAVKFGGRLAGAAAGWAMRRSFYDALYLMIAKFDKGVEVADEDVEKEENENG